MRNVSGTCWAAALAGLLLLAPLAVWAVNVAGVDLIKLGTGVRKLAMLPVYDATLFLPQDLAAAGERDLIAADRPMAMIIRIESRLVSTELFVSSVEKGFRNAAAAGYATDKSAQFLALFKGVEIKKGAIFQQNYVSGRGLTVTYTAPGAAARVLGTVPGLATKRAFMAIFIGPRPVAAELKRGLLAQN